MNYVEIINLIFLGISVLISIYLFHFIFFAISGLFHKKRYPKAERYCRYGIIVSCKDEENVIARLINSIREADYPQDKLDIYVIAHNCSDNTAKVARNLGALVIEDNNKEENTLGQAYHFAFPRIKNKDEYDGFIFFNADNTVKKDYFQKINDAFVYYGCKATVTTFRNSLNINQGYLPATYAMYFGTSCLLCFQGRDNFNVNGRVTGCGFVIPKDRVKDGWNYLSMTEDIEYSSNTTLLGEEIHFCHDAVFYDEQPTKWSVVWHQRRRWAKGIQLVSKMLFAKLLKAFFSRKTKKKVSIYTSLTFHSFIVPMTFFMFVIQIILLFLSPLFGISLNETFLYWNNNANWFMNMFFSMRTGYLFVLAKTAIGFILSAFLTYFLVYIAGHDEYKKAKKWNIFLGFLIFPFFMFLQYPLDLSVLFAKDVKWVKIKHGEEQ